MNGDSDRENPPEDEGEDWLAILLAIIGGGYIAGRYKDRISAWWNSLKYPVQPPVPPVVQPPPPGGTPATPPSIRIAVGTYGPYAGAFGQVLAASALQAVTAQLSAAGLQGQVVIINGQYFIQVGPIPPPPPPAPSPSPAATGTFTSPPWSPIADTGCTATIDANGVAHTTCPFSTTFKHAVVTRGIQASQIPASPEPLIPGRYLHISGNALFGSGLYYFNEVSVYFQFDQPGLNPPLLDLELQPTHVEGGTLQAAGSYIGKGSDSLRPAGYSAFRVRLSPQIQLGPFDYMVDLYQVFQQAISALALPSTTTSQGVVHLEPGIEIQDAALLGSGPVATDWYTCDLSGTWPAVSPAPTPTPTPTPAPTTPVSVYHVVNICSPSEPNYLAVTTGYSQGRCGTDAQFTTPADSIFNLVKNANKKWAAYAEGLSGLFPGWGDTSSNGGLYSRHFPPSMLSQLIADPTLGGSGTVADYQGLTTGADFVWITPNGVDDGHDSSDPTADTWLKNSGIVERFLAAGYTVILWWDEGTTQPTIVLGSGNKVCVVAMENRSFGSVVGNLSGWPYVNSLITGITPTSTTNTQYDVLKTIEQRLVLGSLNTGDAGAAGLR